MWLSCSPVVSGMVVRLTPPGGRAQGRALLMYDEGDALPWLRHAGRHALLGHGAQSTLSMNTCRLHVALLHPGRYDTHVRLGRP